MVTKGAMGGGLGFATPDIQDPFGNAIRISQVKPQGE